MDCYFKELNIEKSSDKSNYHINIEASMKNLTGPRPSKVSNKFEELKREIAKLELELSESIALYNSKLNKFETLKHSSEEGKNLQSELSILSLMIQESQKKLTQLRKLQL